VVWRLIIAPGVFDEHPHPATASASRSSGTAASIPFVGPPAIETAIDRATRFVNQGAQSTRDMAAKYGRPRLVTRVDPYSPAIAAIIHDLEAMVPIAAGLNSP
jgi:hypothetical protein